MAAIKVYNLDSVGVVVDTNPVGNPDGQLTKAQNAVPDPIGEAGSLRKRPGLKPFNSTAASGAITGAVSVPIAIGSAAPNFVNPFLNTPVTVVALQTPVYKSTTVQLGATFSDESWAQSFDPQGDYSDIEQLLQQLAALLAEIAELEAAIAALDASLEALDAERIAALTAQKAAIDAEVTRIRALIDAVDIPEALDRFDPDANALDMTDDAVTSAANPTSADAVSLIPIMLFGNVSGAWELILNSTATQHVDSSVTLQSNLRMKLYPGQATRTGIAGFTAMAAGLTLTYDDPAACIFNNKLYYASGDYTPGTTNPRIRCYDGQSDVLALALPTTLNGSFAAQHISLIQNLLAHDDTIYFSTLDGGTPSASTGVGSVFAWAPATGSLQRVGAAFATDQVPYSLCWAYGKLWCGTQSQSGSCKVYWIRPGIDSAWTLDTTFASGQSAVYGLVQFQGLLYASLQNRTLAGSVFVQVRAIDGTWSASDTGTADTNAGHSAARGYTKMVVWPPEGSGITSPAPALYVGRSAATEDTWPNKAIRKLSAAGVWSTVLSGSIGLSIADAATIDAVTGAIVPALWIGGGVTAYNTTDGTTWTDRSAQITIATSIKPFPGFIIQA